MAIESPRHHSQLLRLVTLEASASPLAQLDRRYRSVLLTYFERRVHSAAEAEDLTQDVFERVLRSLAHGPIRNAEALLFRIAINLLRDRARKSLSHGIEEPLQPDLVAEFADAFTEDLSPERFVIGERTLQEALAALDELGERTRAIFQLYRFENLRAREIADLYRISISGVEKQIARALLHLTRRMQPRWRTQGSNEGFNDTAFRLRAGSG